MSAKAPTTTNPDAMPERELPPAAKRALAEAEERRRRQAAAQHSSEAAPEQGGRKGPDPVRYGDWENGGIASDF